MGRRDAEARRIRARSGARRSIYFQVSKAEGVDPNRRGVAASRLAQIDALPTSAPDPTPPPTAVVTAPPVVPTTPPPIVTHTPPDRTAMVAPVVPPPTVTARRVPPPRRHCHCRRPDAALNGADGRACSRPQACGGFRCRKSTAADAPTGRSFASPGRARDEGL